jgi:pimeloyl-ACP methyl ester carboxylesterase
MQPRSPLVKQSLVVGRFRIPYAVTAGRDSCLICVNGMQQTMAAWRAFIAASAELHRTHQIVLFDFPAQGRAETLSGTDEASLSEQVHILGAVVDAVRPGLPVSLIGGSWGGVVAAAYAAARPERVSRLILGSFRTRPNEWLRTLTRRGQALIDAGDLDSLGTLFVEGFGEGMRPAGQARLREQFRRLTPVQLRQLYSTGEALLDHDDMSDVIDLASIRAHTLIVNGADDPIVDADDAASAAERIRRCEVRLLPGIGHFLHMEEPSVVQIYREFLTRPE